MDMNKFYFPGSILVYGVSDRPGNLGRDVVKNINRFGFNGPVYGFGREEMVIDGRQVYSDIGRIPVTPDVAVLLAPAAAVPDAIEQCARIGVRHAVIEAGGFSELGAERAALEEEVVRVALRNGISCMGPNCLGVINREIGLCMPFIPFPPEELLPGRNSFVAQSGGLVHEMIRRCAAENIGLQKITSIGNKLMIDENDVLEYLLDDEATDAVGIYLEDIKNGRRLMSLASVAKKPIVLLKGNASPAAQEIASFHTAALLGDEAVTGAALRQAGVHQVRSLQEMVDCLKIFGLPLISSPLMNLPSSRICLTVWISWIESMSNTFFADG
jgi:acetyltransferase